MAVVVDLCKPNRKLQRCGFTTNQLSNQIKVMLLYYFVSLEQPYILSCASRNAHLTLASHQRISDWEKTNPEKKKKKSEQFLLGHCPGLRQQESIKQQLEQEHEAADRRSRLTTPTSSQPLHLHHKTTPLVYELCLTGQVKYSLNWGTKEKTKGICISLHYLESNNTVRESSSRDNVIDIHQILTFNSGSWGKSRIK